MMIRSGSVTLVASTPTQISLPVDPTRRRKWQLYIASATAAFEITDSVRKTAAGSGLPVPVVTGASGAFEAEVFGPGDSVWFLSSGTPTISYVWKEVV